jgi:hypothetical protein
MTAASEDEPWTGGRQWDPVEAFDVWAKRVGATEAYRVVRKPSSHGGMHGWQLTVWRTGEAWWSDEQALDYQRATPAAAPAPVVCNPIRGETLAKAFERVGFFAEGAWEDHGGMNGFHARFEGYRASGGQATRTVWSPTSQPAGHPAATIFALVEGLFLRRAPERPSSSSAPLWIALLVIAAVLGAAAWWFFAG